jgi:hypothetical protein
MPDVAVTSAPVYMLFILPAYGVLPVVHVDVDCRWNYKINLISCEYYRNATGCLNTIDRTVVLK